MYQRNKRFVNRAKPPTVGDTISARQERRHPVIDPSIFAGPAGWVTLHSAAAAYEPWQAKGFKMLVEGFANTFPCPRCREHFRKHLKEIPLEKYLGNRDEVFLWTYLMHDKVNKIKRVKSPPLEQVKRYYFESLNLNCDDCGVH